MSPRLKRVALQEADALQRWQRILKWAAVAVLSSVASTVGWLILFSTLSPHPDSTELRTELDLRSLMRGHPESRERKPLALPRGRVVLTMLLPVSSDVGPYDVQVLDAQLASKASAGGEAHLRNEVMRLETILELGSLSSGAHHLAIRRTRGDWQLFPVIVD